MTMPVPSVSSLFNEYRQILPASLISFLMGIGSLMAEPLQTATKEELILHAQEFGLQGDGVTDDGPAIRRMLDRADTVEVPVTLKFPPNRRIFVGTGTERYAFRIDATHDLMIDGGGSTFVIQEDLRFLRITRSRNFQMVRLNVDVNTSPVAEGVILGLEDEGRSLWVRLDDPKQSAALGGPTLIDGEQSFFGMIWLPSRYAEESAHYYLASVQPSDRREFGKGVVEVRGERRIPERALNKVRPGVTRISLPVPGVAHRHGPGAMVVIDRCENVLVEDVEIWAAAWFAYQIFRNDGALIFRRAHIRPEPNSGKVTSSWRDGFHVKGNRGKLLFEECILEGMNDDAFNISTHKWKVTEVLAPNRVRVRQVFPIQFMPVQEGGDALILSADGSRRLESARIESVAGDYDDTIYDRIEKTLETKRAPNLEVGFDRPVPGLQVGSLLWDRTTSNPRTIIRGCVIRNSCRFQSGNLTLENCDVYALLWFYSAPMEGPMPENVEILDSVLRQGRGNPEVAASFLGWQSNGAPKKLPPANQFPMRNLRIENNTIYGDLQINGAAKVILTNNRFADANSRLIIENSIDVQKENEGF